MCSSPISALECVSHDACDSHRRSAILECSPSVSVVINRPILKKLHKNPNAPPRIAEPLDAVVEMDRKPLRRTRSGASQSHSSPEQLGNCPEVLVEAHSRSVYNRLNRDLSASCVRPC